MRLFSTDPNEPGVIAVGQHAVGIFAFGQFAYGVVAVGQIARGVIAIGQGAAGVFAIGQVAFGVFAGGLAGFGLWRSYGWVSLGAWRVGGLLGIGGRHASGGIVLPLVPTSLEEPLPSLPKATPSHDLERGTVSEGWMTAVIGPDGRLVADLPLGATVVGEEIQSAIREGHDRAMVRVRVTHAPRTDYRAVARRELVADHVITWSSRRPRCWAFAGGAPFGRATKTAIVVRALVQGVLVLTWIATAVAITMAPP